MLVKDVLKNKGTTVITIKQDETLCNLLELLTRKKIGSVIVYDDKNEIVGIITEKDILKCFGDKENLKYLQVKDYMTPKDKLIIATVEDDIQYAMNMMISHRIKHLPIFKDNKLFGIISIGDIVKAQLKQTQLRAKTYLDLLKGEVPQDKNLEF